MKIFLISKCFSDESVSQIKVRLNQEARPESLLSINSGGLSQSPSSGPGRLREGLGGRRRVGPGGQLREGLGGQPREDLGDQRQVGLGGQPREDRAFQCQGLYYLRYW